jgi:hypothetical protein
MAESPLIDIFDLCVERLAAGETVEDCLRDYPEHAAELRSLLETGFLVFQAQADTTEEQRAQAQTRSRIEEALQTDFAPTRGKKRMQTDSDTDKSKHRPFTIRRSVFLIGSAAAAVFALAFGFSVGVTPMTQAPAVADASLIDADHDGVSNAQEAALGIDPKNADSDGDGLEDGVEVQIWNTIPSKFDSDGDGLSDGKEINWYLTNAVSMDTDGDGWSDSDEINQRKTNPLVSDKPEDIAAEENAFVLTATQYVLEITQTAQVASEERSTATPPPTTTTTSTPTAFPTATPAGTTVPNLGSASASGDTAITGEVAGTSVALYLGMTATPFAMMDAEGAYHETEKDLSAGSSSLDGPAAPIVPDMGAPVLLGEERDGLSDDFAGRTDSVIVPFGGDAVPLSTSLPYTPSTDVLGDPTTPERGILGPINMQQQLDAMKAGEIDDNAEWDTYTEFRRNYLSTYGDWTVNDYDISGRRIIKVVDALGQPILGAHVEVYMDKLKVSNTITYATGMTLFFPNALEDTKRRDEFQIIVSYDQYQSFYTLDLRKVGDAVEIQMPIVIVREPSADVAATAAAINADAAFIAATAAAINADNAAANATNAANAAQVAADMAETATIIPMYHIAATVTPVPTFTPTPATR